LSYETANQAQLIQIEFSVSSLVSSQIHILSATRKNTYHHFNTQIRTKTKVSSKN